MSRLFLLFSAGGSRFAMSTSDIVEVLPALEWTEVPHSPDGVAGIFSYRGQTLPLVDLSLLTAGRPSVVRMSTRIAVVRSPETLAAAAGLIVEKATETMRASEQDFKTSGLVLAAPYLGRVLSLPDGILQHFDVKAFLKSDFAERLAVAHAYVCN